MIDGDGVTRSSHSAVADFGGSLPALAACPGGQSKISFTGSAATTARQAHAMHVTAARPSSLLRGVLTVLLPQMLPSTTTCLSPNADNRRQVGRTSHASPCSPAGSSAKVESLVGLDHHDAFAGRRVHDAGDELEHFRLAIRKKRLRRAAEHQPRQRLRVEAARPQPSASALRLPGHAWPTGTRSSPAPSIDPRLPTTRCSLR